MRVSTPAIFNKWLFTAFLLFISFGCKTISTTATNSSFGVEKGDNFFSIAVLPDTQYYTAKRNGGSMDMFEDQIKWIRDNKKSENIAYVIHLGDVTDRNTEAEWVRAKNVLYQLEADNIPYGVAVGNHDQTPNGNPAKGDPNTGYTKYFGKSHFKNKKWYGGAMGNTDNSDSHFDVFEANGQKFIVVYFVYNDPKNKNYSAEHEKQVMHWADSILTRYNDHKAILVNHGLVDKPKGSNSNTTPGQGNNSVPSEHTTQGKVIYAMAKHHPNVFLMLGGHISGEGFRRDVYNGNTIKTYLTDYQFRQNPPYSSDKDRNGGNGMMRVMKLNTSKQTLSVVSFAPKRTGLIKEEDGDSQFTEPLYK